MGREGTLPWMALFSENREGHEGFRFGKEFSHFRN